MIQMDLFESLVLKYASEPSCNDNSCDNCKELKQLRDSEFMQIIVQNIIEKMSPMSQYEDIYHTFYAGFVIGRRMSELKVKK